MKQINIKQVCSNEEEKEVFVFLKSQKDYDYEVDSVTDDIYVSVFDFDMILREVNERLAKKSNAVVMLEEYISDFFYSE